MNKQYAFQDSRGWPRLALLIKIRKKSKKAFGDDSSKRCLNKVKTNIKQVEKKNTQTVIHHKSTLQISDNHICFYNCIDILNYWIMQLLWGNRSNILFYQSTGIDKVKNLFAHTINHDTISAIHDNKTANLHLQNIPADHLSQNQRRV